MTAKDKESLPIVSFFNRILGHISGGRVLDVGTGQGSFMHVLTQGLRDYTEIVGIDRSEKALQAARDGFDAENIRFVAMNAEQLDFSDESFDTVCLAASLHHLENIPQVLAEMQRVLKPKGHCIICEMHRDVSTQAQQSVVHVHHWAARVDRARGVSHNPTLSRQEIIALVEGLGLENLAIHEHEEPDSDPWAKEALQGTETAIERVLGRAADLPNYAEFQQQADRLRQAIQATGVQREPVLAAVGQKAKTTNP